MVSVIIPALNEAQAIGLTVSDVTKVLQNEGIRHFEVVVVDDGSQDGTGEIAAEHGAIVVKHVYNLGYGRSLKDGILAATHDTVVIIDADGTYPISEVPVLLSLYNRGYDLVVGRRRGAHYKESWLKLPLRAALRFLVEFTAGQSIPDINSGMRIFSKRTIIPYFDQLCNTFSFTTSQTLAYLLTGKFVGYHDIDYHQRIGEKKVKLFKDSLRTLQYIVQSVLYYNPLKLFLLLTTLTAGFGVMCLTAAATIKATEVFLLGIGSILVSALIFSLGLLADQLRQILMKVQYRNLDGNTVRGNIIVSELKKVANR